MNKLDPVFPSVESFLGINKCGTLFFSGEGPHSRHYGRTAALRLIVQPYDEDELDDYFLSSS
jgi:hypothetical protein